MDAKEEQMLVQHGQFQQTMTQYLNQQNNPVKRGDSIPVEAHDNYFVQRRDNVGRLSLFTFQKITTVFRMLAYGCPTDATDEYIKIRESTTIESLKRFYRAVMEEFTDEYLRSPNAIDVVRLLRIGPIRFLHKHILHDIMTTCIIMYNMIITDERDVDASLEDHMEAPTPETEMMLDEIPDFNNS
ncbi:hypothetical protein Ddye_012042 [Dipteronia dyeriana]|uniref:Uncharacterized protein n=1 Tax=Dipteronia dyeriana TaxID=168575 RepID=A0AAD9X3L6_9ROSI|nr:hypothetical protein Ddye_012042 [Dipteronia dyeriana]